jgi:hypothetical protein
MLALPSKVRLMRSAIAYRIPYNSSPNREL